MNREGKVLVLGKGVRRIAAQGHEDGLSPGADRARDNRNGAERRQRPSFKILGGDIFEGLPAGHQIYPVADYGVSGDGADQRVVEPPGQHGDCIGWKQGVGVQGVDLAQGDDFDLIAELFSIGLQFGPHRLPSLDHIGLGAVDQMYQDSCALHMAEEANS